jgi:hypothetical protein
MDEEAVRRAVVTRTSVNLIHHETHLKVALFAAGGTPLDAQQLARRKRIVLPDGREICIHPPEDILLQKLRWYRLGGEVSDRQWRDVLGIVRTQQERLDREYLAEGALALDVGDLLERRQAPSSRWLSPTRSETRCSRRLAPLIETDATIGIWCAGSLCSAASATLSRASCPSSRLRSPPLKSIDLARYFELRSNAPNEPRAVAT